MENKIKVRGFQYLVNVEGYTNFELELLIDCELYPPLRQTDAEPECKPVVENLTVKMPQQWTWRRTDTKNDHIIPETHVPEDLLDDIIEALMDYYFYGHDRVSYGTGY